MDLPEESPDGRCSHCLRPVPADLGVENSAGDILCGACFKVLGSRPPRRKIPREGIGTPKRARIR